MKLKNVNTFDENQMATIIFALLETYEKMQMLCDVAKFRPFSEKSLKHTKAKEDIDAMLRHISANAPQDVSEYINTRLELTKAVAIK